MAIFVITEKRGFRVLPNQNINYLHNILKRSKDEMLLRVYNAQKENPLQGNFFKLIENDLKLINQNYNENFF